jgi:hypothetical protein
MNVRKAEDILNLKRKHLIALCGKIAFEGAVSLS